MMQQGGSTTTSAATSPTSTYRQPTNQMLPTVHVTSQGAQAMPSATTTTAQVQEAHSTTSHLTTAAAAAQTASAAQLQEAEAALEHDKKAIYRHPLFPLMALLFEKCEQATQTPDCPSSDSFDVDIQAFVHHQEQDRKPFFSDDPELDNLMVKAIQVLRIHLLELEKVNELCKDFCTRYITCLKGKLQSENLLRSDMPSLDPCSSPPLGSPPPSNNVTQPASMAALGQGQIVSGGTIYQMVQTPQGLVAQPIQQIQNNNNSNSSSGQSPGSHQATPVIHGSTPLSQIGVPTAPSSSQNASVTSSPMVLNAMDLSDDEDYMGKKKNKRGVLPKQATQVMKSWLFQHIVHPYPTEDEKRTIAGQTNLSLLQVNNWFINARRRILQPMLDASNPTETKTKKAKTTNRPVQRFWPDNIANLATQQPRPDATSTPTSTPSTPTEPQSNSGRATPTSPPADNTTPSSTPSSTPQPIMLHAGTMVTSEGHIVNTETRQVIGQLPRSCGSNPSEHVMVDSSEDESVME